MYAHVGVAEALYRRFEPFRIVDHKIFIIDANGLATTFVFSSHVLEGKAGERVDPYVIALHSLLHQGFNQETGCPTLVAAHLDRSARHLDGQELPGKLQDLRRQKHVGIPDKWLARVNRRRS